MATFIKIFSNKEIAAFDNPPVFSSHDRKKYFFIGKWEQNRIDKCKIDMGKIGFILQLGYFKATKKFYTPNKFKEADVIYISMKLNIPIDSIDFKSLAFFLFTGKVYKSSS